MEKVDLLNAKILYEPHFFSHNEASELLEYMLAEFPWEKNQIKLFGKQYDVPRLEAYFADKGMDYSYSGKKLKINPWDKRLIAIKNRVENLINHEFNACLANYYRDGNDSNGLHSDNEKELGVNPVIASLSFGSTRKFRLKHNQTKEVMNFELTHGSLLVMAGECQHFWKHEIPKQKKIKEERINLTFRKILGG